MADQKPAASRPVEAASAAPGEKRAAVRPQLAKAAEATDGYVQWLLAERNTADQNGDADRAGWATAELGKLGFE